MFKKIQNCLSVFVLLSVLLITGYSNAQVSGISESKEEISAKKSIYPIFTLSPMAGGVFPVGELGNNFEAGFSGALDLGIRVNKEVGIFTNVGYNSLTSKIEGAPNSSYFSISAGPRYYFTKPNLKSAFYLEAGVGAYIYSQDAYTTVTSVDTLTYDRASNTNAGLNVGPGFTMNLSKAVDFIIKAKYHLIFNDGGTRSFITALGGLEFKF